MRKYENVDVIAALGAVVELNTEHYKSDFKYDVERFKKAAKHPDGENNRLLWMSRQSGTWCFRERDAYVKDAEAFNYWNGYAKILGDANSYMSTVIVQDRILAFAVEVKGMENGRVKGDIYELDYRDHIRQLNHAALPLHTVTATYKDGTTVTLSRKEHDAKHMSLFHQHGQLQTITPNPEDAGHCGIFSNRRGTSAKKKPDPPRLSCASRIRNSRVSNNSLRREKNSLPRNAPPRPRGRRRKQNLTHWRYKECLL